MGVDRFILHCRWRLCVSGYVRACILLTHRSTARFCVCCRVCACVHTHTHTTHTHTHTHARARARARAHTHTRERERERQADRTTERQTDRGSKPCSVQFSMFYSGLLSSIHACNNSYRNTPYPRVTKCATVHGRWSLCVSGARSLWP